MNKLQLKKDVYICTYTGARKQKKEAMLPKTFITRKLYQSFMCVKDKYTSEI